jgi:gluconolactonase
MKKFLALYFLAAVAIPGFSFRAYAQSQIERLDPALDAIVPGDVVVEKLADTPEPGTREGPVWLRNGNFLIYSDVPNKAFNKWNPADGTVSVFLRDAEGDGITVDREGRVVWAAEGKVVRLERDGKTRTVLADQFNGKPLNAPNDLVYKTDGTLYFTDPGHFLMNKEQTVNLSHDVPAVYSINNGKLHLLTNEIVRANGIAFAPGEKYLYINSSFGMRIFRYDVQPDDGITNPQVFIDMNADHQHPYSSAGFPDGMKTDVKGNVYCTGPGGIWIISAEGKHLGTILNLNRPANLAFGGPDGKTLFISSRPGLYRIRLKITGIRP